MTPRASTALFAPPAPWNGSSLMPVKMPGSEISTIELLMVASRMPRVVSVGATHL